MSRFDIAGALLLFIGTSVGLHDAFVIDTIPNVSLWMMLIGIGVILIEVRKK
jgi:hypothetical protein